MKVLLIEDDPINRGVLVDSLRRDGFYVCDAPDAVTALESLRHGRPDLIVTDLALPGMSGEAMLKRPECRGIPVMAMTAKVIPDTLPPDTELLPKPFTCDEFMTRVRRRRTELHTRQAADAVTSTSDSPKWSSSRHDP